MPACRWGPPRKLTRIRQSATRFPCTPTFWSPIRRSQVSLSRGEILRTLKRFSLSKRESQGLWSCINGSFAQRGRSLASFMEWTRAVGWRDFIHNMTFFLPHSEPWTSRQRRESERVFLCLHAWSGRILGVEFSDFFLLGGQATWCEAIPLPFSRQFSSFGSFTFD